jgi:pyrroloquinoline quinone biosynthesis protein D
MSKAITKATGQFSETAIDDEIVVMHLVSGEFFSLTGTGRDLWLLIDGSRSRSDLLADMAAQYGAQPAEIAGDVDAFLVSLGAAGFLDPA